MSLAFSLLQEKFSTLFSRFSNNKTLSPEDIDNVLRSLRLAFLDADVALSVIKSFIDNMRKRLSETEKDNKKQNPQEFIMGIVHEELINLLEGNDPTKIKNHDNNASHSVVRQKNVHQEEKKKGLLFNLKKTLGLQEKNNPWSTVMMVGLQGNGKTTMSAKLAYILTKERNDEIEMLREALKTQKNNLQFSPEKFLQEQKEKQKEKPQDIKVLLVSLDTYRPGAQEQLAILGKKISVDSLPIIQEEKPLNIAERALIAMEKRIIDNPQSQHIVIFDTAGRLQCDEILMQELKDLKSLLKPDEIFFVADSLLGQQGLTIAKGFHDSLNLTGVCLSKTESDSRCGIVLSLKAALGIPIKLMGTGEQPQDVTAFDAQSIVSRILDQGDMMALVEKASSVMTKDQQEQTINDLKSGHFTLNHFAEKLHFMEKMGGFSNLLQYMPGIGKMKKEIEEKAKQINIKHQLAIISSMTPKERLNPSLLTLSRQKRIAIGSGLTVKSVQDLIKRFEEMKKLMSHFKGLF